MWIRFRSVARALAPVALTVPLAVAVDIPEDSTVTQLRISGGAGSYLAVVRDCNGDIISSASGDFHDAGISVEHLGESWGYGLDVGYLNDTGVEYDHTNFYPPQPANDREAYFYLSPNVQVSTPSVGATLGFLYTTRELPYNDDVPDGDRSGATLYPTFSFRVGNPARMYASMHLFSTMPVYSGGDYGAIGVGIAPAPRVRLWGGLGTGGLYSDDGVLLQGDFEVKRGLWLGFNTRYGSSDEYGAGLSLAYRWSGR